MCVKWNYTQILKVYMLLLNKLPTGNMHIHRKMRGNVQETKEKKKERKKTKNNSCQRVTIVRF
jgi:hypothetical protein